MRRSIYRFLFHPSWQALVLAYLPEFLAKWKTGADRILVLLDRLNNHHDRNLSDFIMFLNASPGSLAIAEFRA